MRSAASLSLPGTVEDVKWGADICFCVGEKMYAVTGMPDSDVPIRMTLKVSADAFDALTQQDGVVPAPYLARYKWIKLDDPGALPDDMIAALVRGSYELVFRKLPAGVRRKIA